MTLAEGEVSRCSEVVGAVSLTSDFEGELEAVLTFLGRPIDLFGDPLVSLSFLGLPTSPLDELATAIVLETP
jgi:hypothetical protein